jgi:hypothetical protein
MLQHSGMANTKITTRLYFSLWGFVKGALRVPPMPAALHENQHHFKTQGWPIYNEGKVLPVSTIKVYTGSDGTTPLILNLGTRCQSFIMLRYDDKGKVIPVQVWLRPEASRRLKRGKVVSPRHRSPLLPKHNPATHYCQRLCRPQGHSAAGRMMSMKSFNDTIGNRTRGLPACRPVTKPTAPQRTRQ